MTRKIRGAAVVALGLSVVLAAAACSSNSATPTSAPATSAGASAAGGRRGRARACALHRPGRVPDQCPDHRQSLRAPEPVGVAELLHRPEGVVILAPVLELADRRRSHRGRQGLSRRPRRPLNRGSAPDMRDTDSAQDREPQVAGLPTVPTHGIAQMRVRTIRFGPSTVTRSRDVNPHEVVHVSCSYSRHRRRLSGSDNDGANHRVRGTIRLPARWATPPLRHR